jgi:predicted signal transduction protein with EAL and GGDEF domain
LGGDEFAIVQHATSNTEFTGDLAAKLVECMGLPFVIEGHSVSIGASVGVALAPADASTAIELLKNADLALYRAKAEGGDIHRFFEPEMDRLMQARRTLELDLRDAMKNGELELHYQPPRRFERQQGVRF